MWIKNLIFPIFKALMADELLEKCMHGKTQNANEALNAIIWSCVPKSIYVGKKRLKWVPFQSSMLYILTMAEIVSLASKNVLGRQR